MNEDGNNALTAQKDEDFTITELEVWEVTLSPDFDEQQYLNKMEPIKQLHIKKREEFKEK